MGKKPQRAVIFANGALNNLNSIQTLIQSDDLIIAADGGALHCLALGITPAVVIGDFDSLDETTLNHLKSLGVTILHHPTHKDETDLELVLQYAYQQGATKILILAALGESRWDMNLGNILLLAHPDLTDIQVNLVAGNQEISLIHSGQSHQILGHPGDIVSLIPIGGDVNGIITDGLEYTLRDGSLEIGYTRGISNSLIGDTAVIYIKQGLLICTIIHQKDDGNV